MKLEIPKFNLGDQEITNVDIRILNFLDFVAAVGLITNQKDYQRARLRAALRLNGEDATDEQITALPIAVAKKILAGLDAREEGQAAALGELVANTGDGMESPMIYKLGTPLSIQQNGKTLKVQELEFMARTFGDLEEVLAAPTALIQTAELIKRVAVPVGVPGLTILPEPLQRQITIEDGLVIAQKVLPPFV